MTLIRFQRLLVVCFLANSWACGSHVSSPSRLAESLSSNLVDDAPTTGGSGDQLGWVRYQNLPIEGCSRRVLAGAARLPNVVYVTPLAMVGLDSRFAQDIHLRAPAAEQAGALNFTVYFPSLELGEKVERGEITPPEHVRSLIEPGCSPQRIKERLNLLRTQSPSVARLLPEPITHVEALPVSAISVSMAGGLRTEKVYFGTAGTTGDLTYSGHSFPVTIPVENMDKYRRLVDMLTRNSSGLPVEVGFHFSARTNGEWVGVEVKRKQILARLHTLLNLNNEMGANGGVEIQGVKINAKTKLITESQLQELFRQVLSDIGVNVRTEDGSLRQQRYDKLVERIIDKLVDEDKSIVLGPDDSLNPDGSTNGNGNSGRPGRGDNDPPFFPPSGGNFFRDAQQPGQQPADEADSKTGQGGAGEEPAEDAFQKNTDQKNTDEHRHDDTPDMDPQQIPTDLGDFPIHGPGTSGRDDSDGNSQNSQGRKDGAPVNAHANLTFKFQAVLQRLAVGADFQMTIDNTESARGASVSVPTVLRSRRSESHKYQMAFQSSLDPYGQHAPWETVLTDLRGPTTLRIWPQRVEYDRLSFDMQRTYFSKDQLLKNLRQFSSMFPFLQQYSASLADWTYNGQPIGWIWESWFRVPYVGNRHFRVWGAEQSSSKWVIESRLEVDTDQDLFRRVPIVVGFGSGGGSVPLSSLLENDKNERWKGAYDQVSGSLVVTFNPAKVGMVQMRNIEAFETVKYVNLRYFEQIWANGAPAQRPRYVADVYNQSIVEKSKRSIWQLNFVTAEDNVIIDPMPTTAVAGGSKKSE